MKEAIRVSIPGHGNLMGSPATIVRLLKEARFDYNAGRISDDAYMMGVCREIKRLYEKQIEFSGDTIEEQAETFLRSMEANGFLKIEKV
jgi:hypothetical protein